MLFCLVTEEVHYRLLKLPRFRSTLAFSIFRRRPGLVVDVAGQRLRGKRRKPSQALRRAPNKESGRRLNSPRAVRLTFSDA
jgi:hypothetical protein